MNQKRLNDLLFLSHASKPGASSGTADAGVEENPKARLLVSVSSGGREEKRRGERIKRLSRGNKSKPEPRLRYGNERDGWCDPGGRQPSGFKIVIFIVIDGEINVTLRAKSCHYLRVKVNGDDVE